MKDVFQSDCFGSPVFNIRHGVVQDTFKKSFHSQPSLVVDRGRNTFDSPTSRQSPDGGLGDPMDRVLQDFSVALDAEARQLAS